MHVGRQPDHLGTYNIPLSLSRGPSFPQVGTRVHLAIVLVPYMYLGAIYYT